jgi:hypothetical protein
MPETDEVTPISNFASILYQTNWVPTPNFIWEPCKLKQDKRRAAKDF